MSLVVAVSEAWTSLKRRAREEVLLAQGVSRLDRSTAEPPPGLSSRPDGICAVGGDLGTDRLIVAFCNGAYPSIRPGRPLVWMAPDPRYVVDLARARVSRNALHTLVRSRFDVTLDRAFDDVIAASTGGAEASFLNAFLRLHRMGYAHSVECWSGEKLVAGSYGLAIGAAFFSVRAFSSVDGAGEVASAALHERLREWSFSFVDYQTPARHPTQLGQEPWARSHFLVRLAEAVTLPARKGRWAMEGHSPLSDGVLAVVGDSRRETGA